MARGVRKSPVEKMQGELADVQASIAQYESCLLYTSKVEKDYVIYNERTFKCCQEKSLCCSGIQYLQL